MAKQRFVCIVQIQLATDSRCHIIDKDQFIIGRVPGADLLLPSPRLSRHHVSIAVSETEITVMDLDSSNGTFINGARIEPKKPYSVPFNTPFQLAGPQISVIINIIDRPLELENHQTVMKKFNQEASLWFEKVHSELQGQTQQIIETARAKAQEMANQVVSEAQAERETILKEAATLSAAEKEKIRSDIRKQMQNEVDQILQKAKIEAETLRQQATLLAKNESKLLLEEEIKKVQQETRQQCLEIKQIAQTEADQLIHTTNQRVLELKGLNEKEIRELLIQAQKEAKEIVQEANTKSDEILTESRNTGKKIRDDAQKNYEQITAAARRAATETIEKQQKESAALQNEIIQDAKSRAAREALLVTEEAKRKAEEIIDQATEQAESLSRKIEHLNLEAAKLSEKQKEVDEMELKRSSLLKEIEKIEDNFSNLKAQEVEILKLINEKKQIEKSKIDIEKKLNELQEEFAGARQKNLVEHDLLKKKQKDELHAMQLKMHEELEILTQEEEKKFRAFVEMQKVELAKHIELALIPDLGRTLNLGALSPEQVTFVGNKITAAVQLATANKDDSSWDVQKIASSMPKGLVQNFKRSRRARWAYITAGLVCFIMTFAYVEFLNAPAVQQKNYAEEVIQKRQQEAVFAPEQTDAYRDSYVDNVIYLRNYTDIKLDSASQERWALELNNFFFTELKLSEDKMVKFVGLETALVKRLIQLRASIDAKYLDEGLDRMRTLEDEELVKIKELLQSPKNYKKLRLREKAFVAKEVLSRQRAPANNPSLDFKEED